MLQKAANIYVFKSGKTDKWVQMPIMFENWPQTELNQLWNPTQNTRNSNTNENFQNMLNWEETDFIQKSPGKMWEKRKSLAKYVLRPILEILKTRKMKNARV